MIVEILLFFVLIFMVIYWYSTKHFGFFKKIGVPEAPGTFPFGSNQSWKVWTGKVSMLESFDDPEGLFVNDKYFGIYSFGQRQLIVKARSVNLR